MTLAPCRKRNDSYNGCDAIHIINTWVLCSIICMSIGQRITWCKSDVTMERLAAAVCLCLILALQGSHSGPLPQQANISVSTDEISNLTPYEDEIGTRSFYTHPGFLWPATDQDGKRIVKVPYTIFRLDEEVHALMLEYVEEFNSKSCIRWVPWQDEPNYVTVTGLLLQDDVARGADPRRCYAFNGVRPGIRLYIAKACLKYDGRSRYFYGAFNVPHEMLHVLGFIHEHQRRDRDCYIDIGDDADPQVNEIRGTYGSDVSFPYDPRSVMQYAYRHFRYRDGGPLGPQGSSLSDMDWMKLNFLYCGGPHICEVDPAACQRHQQILKACG